MHLLVDISAHGFGHLAQTAPVLAALRQRLPTLRLTVRSGLSGDQLASRIDDGFAYVAHASDFGFAMHNAVDIDRPASLARYAALHSDWDIRVSEESERLRALDVDAVLCNAAYLPLAGAACAGIPAAAMCSLNWADLFAHYFGDTPASAAILPQMQAAYRSARGFLRIAPGLPMHSLDNCVAIGPIAAHSPPDRAGTAARHGLPPSARWVLVAMGGMDFVLPVADWPRIPGVFWLTPAAWGCVRDDIRHVDVTGQAFTTLLSSVDAVITKPGYGTFAEAGCHGIPLLYLERPDWPETPHLADWLATHGRSAAVTRDQLLAGDLAPALHSLWAQPAPVRPIPTGAEQAADWLCAHLLGAPTLRSY